MPITFMQSVGHRSPPKSLSRLMMKLAEKQIKIAFDQAQKEVDDLRQRTIEGLQTARLSGKKLGRPHGRCITEKERKAKNIIIKRGRRWKSMH